MHTMCQHALIVRIHVDGKLVTCETSLYGIHIARNEEDVVKDWKLR